MVKIDRRGLILTKPKKACCVWPSGWVVVAPLRCDLSCLDVSGHWSSALVEKSHPPLDLVKRFQRPWLNLAVEKWLSHAYHAGLCSTHESWVKFDSTLTQMSRVRVESAVKIKDMSRVRVESRWSSFESELSQLDTARVKVESMIFRGENVKIMQLSVTLQRKNQPTATFDRTPPPSGQQRFPKLGKMWWVVSQIWLNSDSNELSQSWVRLVNLGF